ncbi:MAG: UDP-N-acetylmuramoyl-L-alanine--D-glutamate ligase, partial [Spirochaetes bacterium]|nr:UDP-N-acetylmuramoyl-L-alanine--D-glutamate ligase [Spirochaetota bacterium]
MNQNDKDKGALKVTIMGLGLNGGGLASALYFASRGALVTVTDLRDETVLAPSIEALKGYPIRYVLGRHELEDFSSADLVIKNPGVRPDNSYLAAAKKVDSDISIFLRQCPCPIIAVTGSKGKSSTASAIHHILQQAGRQSYLGGNITVSPLSFLPELGTDDIVVLELSSWQLGDLQDRSVLKPHCAVLTHIVPDHLDRYGTMERYLADKRIIYQHQDQSCWTICEDEHWGNSFAAETGGRVLQYGSQAPATGAGAWLETDGSGLALLPDLKAEQTALTQTVLLPENLRVPGKHNRMNCLAAG